jgi:hypothetical protein
MRQQTQVCRYLYCNLAYIPSVIIWGVELLVHMAVSAIVSFLRSLHTFSTVVVLIYIPTNSVWGFLFPQYLLFVFLIVAILTGDRWNLDVILISISFMGGDVEHFFICFLPFGLLPLKNLCSVHLLISLWGHWFFWEFSVLSSLHILVIKPLSDV